MVGFTTGFGTAPAATGGSEAGPRGEEGFYRHFGTGTLPTGTSGAPSRGKGRLLAGLRHSDPTHRCLRDIPAWRIGLLSALWHRNPSHRYLRDIPAWRRGLLSTLWHGNPFHRCLSGILARRSVLLTGLRHGDLQLKHFCGRVACRRKGNRYRCRAYGQVCDRVQLGTPGYRWF